MSILSDVWFDIVALFSPSLCPVCGGPMGDGARIACTVCRAEAPMTHFWEQFDNPLTQRLWGLVPVVHASAFLFFVDGSGWRRLVHGFKYRGVWRTARQMGAWYGSYLYDSGFYDDVDLIVAVPLHWRKRLHRGYNQSEYIAEGIASQLGVKVDRRSVARWRNNPSQTLTSTDGRWENVEGIFKVRHPERLAGRHILLVDDVFTTGATIISCAEQIVRTVPECRVSIAILMASHRGMGIDR